MKIKLLISILLLCMFAPALAQPDDSTLPITLAGMDNQRIAMMQQANGEASAVIPWSQSIAWWPTFDLTLTKWDVVADYGLRLQAHSKYSYYTLSGHSEMWQAYSWYWYTFGLHLTATANNHGQEGLVTQVLLTVARSHYQQVMLINSIYSDRELGTIWLNIDGIDDFRLRLGVGS